MAAVRTDGGDGGAGSGGDNGGAGKVAMLVERRGSFVGKSAGGGDEFEGSAVQGGGIAADAESESGSSAIATSASGGDGRGGSVAQDDSSVEGGKESEQLPKRKRGPDAAVGAVGPDAVVGAVAPDTEPQPKKKKKKKRRGKAQKGLDHRQAKQRKQEGGAGSGALRRHR